MRMPSITRGRALAYLGVVAALLVVGGHFMLGGRTAGAQGNPSESETFAPLEVETGSIEPEQPDLVVHVVGAVRRPGLYRLAAGSRVADAIERAGGARRGAALALVNLAAPVVDGGQIVVPARGKAVAASAGAPDVPSGPVHLNTATLEQLDSLPGVGPVTAQKIIDYRDSHGSFGSVDELDAVPGIGPTRLEQLRDLIAP